MIVMKKRPKPSHLAQIKDINSNKICSSCHFPSLNTNVQLLETIGCRFCSASDTVTKLLSVGTDPNAQDSNGDTPLMISVKAGKLHLIEPLLRNGALVNSRNKQQRTALMCAAESGDATAIEILLQAGAQVNLQDANGYTELMYASKFGKTEVVEVLLATSQCALNVRNKHGQEALHEASKAGFIGIVAALIFNGADINAQDRWFNTPLMYATLHGHENVVQFLIQSQADVNLKNYGGRSALHTACERGNKAIVIKLIEAGARLNDVEKEGSTPVLVAAAHRYDAIVQIIINIGCAVNYCDNHGKNLLHYAASCGWYEIAEQLIFMGINADCLDKSLNSPLVLAVKRNYVKIVRLLLWHNCSIDNQHCSAEGQRSIFEIALSDGHKDLLPILVEAGCNASKFSSVCLLANNTLLEDENIRLWLSNVSTTPSSLKHIARTCIRRALGQHLQISVIQLPIPQPLKSFILMKDIFGIS